MREQENIDLVKRLKDVASFFQKEFGRVEAAACLAMEAADAIEALQARVAELEDALKTARRDAFEEAAAVCDDDADKCDDAVKWGGHPKYIANCKAAAYAMRDRAAAIRALAEKG